RLPLKSADQVCAWLAHTELSALDVVRDGILAKTNKAEAELMLAAFSRVKAPEAAPFMLELRLNSRAPALARQWLAEQPGNAVAGLLPVAAGRGKLADAAVEYLRDARRQGLADFIEQQLKGAPAEVADKVSREVLEHAEKVYEPFDDLKTPEWLR